MAETDIYHKQRLRTQIFRKLQEFMEAHAVGAGVSPVVVVVAGALLNRADGLLPFEAVVVLGRTVALDVASARKADKRRLHRLKHFGQVAPASVGTATERGREKTHHVEAERAGLVEREVELAVGSGDRGRHLARHLGPFAVGPECHSPLRGDFAAGCCQRERSGSGIRCIRFHPERK